MNRVYKEKDKTGGKHGKGSKKHSKRSKKSRIVYTVCMVILIGVFLGCGIYLLRYFLQTKKSEDRVDELKEMILTEESEENTEVSDTDDDVPSVEYVDIDGVRVQKKFERLYSDNHDFVGWITIDDTEIDYPVMQSLDDEEFYLHRDYDKSYSYPGTLFIDTSSDVKKPSDNLLIYGHHMQTGKMFGKLEEYADADYCEDHKYITFNTIYGDGEYVVIAAFYSKIYDKDYTGFKYYQFFDASNKEEYDRYVSECKALTSYDIKETAEYGDKLITLSTCAYHTTDGRFVVVARKIN